MKFYFPDSQDLVSPTYDFLRDEYLAASRSAARRPLRPRGSWTRPPTTGSSSASRSSTGRSGAPASTRARSARACIGWECERSSDSLTTSSAGRQRRVQLRRRRSSAVTAEETLDFYEECGFDAGVSTDHVIFGYEPEADADDG